MSLVNFFVDGTWLFNQCRQDGALAHTTNRPQDRFELDLSKLTARICEHIRRSGKAVDGPGDRYFCTSIFALPADLDDWPRKYPGITPTMITRVRANVYARDAFAQGALRAGFDPAAIYRPELRDWILRRLASPRDRYQEKQVDTTVVALLVKYAITRPEEYHVVLSGDADLLPAIRLAYPDYTRNVVVVTTHPDELKKEHRQSSFSFLDFSFDVPHLFLQDCSEDVLAGQHVYRCKKCSTVFPTASQISGRARPYCSSCLALR